MNISLTYTILFTLGLQAMFAVLVIWIACIVFRQRNFVTWTVLVSAIVSQSLSIGSRLVVYTPYLFPSFGRIDPELTYKLSTILSLPSGIAELIFLVSLLLHLQRRKLESDRIAHLEAILHERESTGDARP